MNRILQKSFSQRKLWPNHYMEHGRLRFKEPSDGNLWNQCHDKLSWESSRFRIRMENQHPAVLMSDYCFPVALWTKRPTSPPSADPLQKEFVVATVTSGTGIKWAQCTDIYVTFFSSCILVWCTCCLGFCTSSLTFNTGMLWLKKTNACWLRGGSWWYYSFHASVVTGQLET